MGYANRDIIRACEAARKEGRASFEAILAAVRATQAECPHPEKDCTRGAPPDMEDIVWCRRCSLKLEGPYPIEKVETGRVNRVLGFEHPQHSLPRWSPQERREGAAFQELMKNDEGEKAQTTHLAKLLDEARVRLRELERPPAPKPQWGAQERHEGIERVRERAKQAVALRERAEGLMARINALHAGTSDWGCLMACRELIADFAAFAVSCL
jgi:hypothetical protein